jgi:hypothetical protein
MEKQRIIQTLQEELHAIAERSTANAQSITRIAQLISRLNLSSITDEESIFGFQFPVNDYGYLVHMLTTHPWLKAQKHKWKSESWQRYSIRLSHLTGWNVQKDPLKYCFESLEKKQK